MPLKDISGQRFGRLVVQGRAVVARRGHDTVWVCRCDCGNVTEVRKSCLLWELTRSCGCLRIERSSQQSRTHGMAHKSRAYAVWNQMKQRCRNPKSNAYSNYGGRGITHDLRWESFGDFFEDMGEPPSGLTLERNDVNGPYCKTNCRWATRKEQAQNTRKSVRLKYGGRALTVSEWAPLVGISADTLKARRYHGWSVEELLTTPVQGVRNSINL